MHFEKDKNEIFATDLGADKIYLYSIENDSLKKEKEFKVE